jgi:hypothetical protein
MNANGFEKPKVIVSSSEFRRLNHTNPALTEERYFEIRRAYDDLYKQHENDRAEIERLKDEEIKDAQFIRHQKEQIERLESQHEKDRAEIEGLRLALEDREKIHDQHCQFFEAERLRDRARIEELERIDKVYHMNRDWIEDAKARITELEALVREADNLLVSSLESAISDLKKRRYSEVDIASFEESLANYNATRAVGDE